MSDFFKDPDVERGEQQSAQASEDHWWDTAQVRKEARWNPFFAFLRRRHCPAPIYYWFLDRLTANKGWRPFQYKGWKEPV